jgi:hypothetical protein
VSFAGFAPKAEEYYCKIKAFSKYDPKRSVVFNGDVIPMTLDRDTVTKMGNGLTFTDTIVQKLKCQNYFEKSHDNLYFIVSISKTQLKVMRL